MGAFLYRQGIVVAIASLIGAVLLPATCALYNKIARGRQGPTSVPEPSMGKAMGITFVATLSNAVLAFFILLVMAAVAGAAGARQRNAALMAQLIPLPVSLLVMAGVLSGMLPTTFGRALLVTLLYLVVAVLMSGSVLGMTVLIIRFLGADAYFPCLAWVGGLTTGLSLGKER
jgi:hypothetical protein